MDWQGQQVLVTGAGGFILEVHLGSLAPARDLTFVTDTAEGFLRCAAVDAAIGQEINLGTSTTITIGELAEKILALLGKMPKIVRY